MVIIDLRLVRARPEKQLNDDLVIVSMIYFGLTNQLCREKVLTSLVVSALLEPSRTNDTELKNQGGVIYMGLLIHTTVVLTCRKGFCGSVVWKPDVMARAIVNWRFWYISVLWKRVL